MAIDNLAESLECGVKSFAAILLLVTIAACSGYSSDGTSALEAVERGDLEEIGQVLLSDPVSVAQRDDTGRTPLHIAADSGRDDIVRVLLDADADVNARDRVRVTPLHLASRVGSTKAVEYLLDAGADPIARSRDGSTPIMWAYSSGNRKTISVLLDAGGIENRSDKDVIFAAYWGELSILKQILASMRDAAEEFDSSQSESNVEEWTLLHWAAAGYGADDRLVLEQILDSSRIDVNIRSSSSIVGRNSPLHIAVLFDNADGIGNLLNLGADIEAKNAFQLTPLFVGVRELRLEIVAKLLGYGADPNTRDLSDATPLYWAATIGNEQITDLLLAAGADPNLWNHSGETPLHAAARLGRSEEAVRSLLASGADDQIEDGFGLKAIDWAIRNSHRSIAAILASEVVE